jgi:O-antigen/teichoic acid export membrane protein
MMNEAGHAVEAPMRPVPSLRNAAARLAHGSAVYGAGNFGIKALGFVLVLVYTRFLTPTDYGTVTLAESVATVPALIWGLSLSAGMRRLYFEHLDDPSSLRRYLSTVLRGGLLAIGAGLGITFLVLPPMLRWTRFSVIFYPFVALAVATAGGTSLADLRLTLYQAEENPKAYICLSLLVFFATAVACFALVVGMKWGAFGLLTGKFVGAAIAAATAILLLRRWLGAGWEGSYFRQTMSVSLPLIPHQVLAMALLVADRFVLERYRPLSEVGLYSFAYTLGMVMYLVTVSLEQAWTPLFHDISRGGSSARPVLGHVNSGLALLMTGLGCVGVLLAQPFSRWVLDPRYHATGRLIPWVIGAYLAHAFFSLSLLASVQAKATRYILYSSAIAASANLALNLWWIPRWGMYGAAYATLAGYAIEAALMYFFAQRIFPLPYDRKRIVAGLVIFALVLTVSQFRADTVTMVVTFVATVIGFAFVAGRSLLWVVPTIFSRASQAEQ